MKQLTYYIKSVAIVTALAGFATSCDKTEEASNLPQSQEITLTASTAPRIVANNPDTKVTYDPNGKDALNNSEMSVLWAAGDAFKMYISDGSAGATFTLVGDGGSATGQFSTTDAVSDGDYNILFPAPVSTETRSWTDLTLSYLDQEYDGDVDMSATGTNLSKYNYMVSTATITNNTSTSNIAFKHLGCVLQFTITMPTDYNPTVQGPPVELIVTALGMSSDIKPSAPSATGTSVSTQVLKLKNINLATTKTFTAYLMSAPFTIPANGKLSITVACENGSQGKLYGYSHTFGSTGMTYAAGKRYKFDLSGTKPDEVVSAGEDYVAIAGVKWATGNIVKVLNESKLAFASEANQQGLVFKWGSLIGFNMVGLNGSAFAASSIVFVPSEYTTPISTAWYNIPYENEVTAEDDCGTDKDAFHRLYPTKGYDAATGKGDICRYMSAQGWLKGNWRMPTSVEFFELKEAGAKRQPAALESWPTVSSISDANGQDAISQGCFFGAGAANGTNATMQTPPPNSIFLPAGGLRNFNNGELGFRGSEGYNWSCSPNLNNFGYHLNFYSTGVAPTSTSLRYRGCAVRCVLE